MHITLFSFVTAVLLSSLLIVALYLSRKSVKTIRMLNFGYLACLYLFCLGRIFFSVELPFAAVIRAPSLMNPLHDVNEANLPMMDGAFLVSDLLLLVWAVGSILLFAQFLIRYHRGKRDIDRLPKQENQVLQEILAAEEQTPYSDSSVVLLWFVHTLWNWTAQTTNPSAKPGIYGRRTVSYPAP